VHHSWGARERLSLIYSEKPRGKRAISRTRRKWEDIVIKTECKRMDYIQLDQGRSSTGF
jgi:hypothetical protein